MVKTNKGQLALFIEEKYAASYCFGVSNHVLSTLSLCG